MPKLSRRKVLVAGAGAGVALAGGAALIETRVVPGRTRLHGVLGLTGDDGMVPDAGRGPAVSGSFASAARRTKVGWTVMYPHGRKADARLPVVLLLHGRGGDHKSGITTSASTGTSLRLSKPVRRPLRSRRWTAARTTTGTDGRAGMTRSGC